MHLHSKVCQTILSGALYKVQHQHIIMSSKTPIVSTLFPSFTRFPEEIWMKIFEYCNVYDIITVGNTCWYLKTIADTEYLWKFKWAQVRAKCPLDLPDGDHMDALNVDYKKMCYRLHMIMDQHPGEHDGNFSTCNTCQRFTCLCPVYDSKVVLDIGNKFTWIVTPSFGVRRHLSMFGIPKLDPSEHSKTLSEAAGEDVRSDQQAIEDNSLKDVQSSDSKSNGPFCMFCNSVKLFREKKRKTEPVEHFTPSSKYAALYNGFCSDTVKVLDVPSMDIVSPAAALLSGQSFPVLRDFINHLLRRMGLKPLLQKANSILLFCEPLTICPALRRKLLHYLFQEVKVARVCLVMKPLATCSLMNMRTGIVVDSGALTTSVAVVLDSQVPKERWRVIPVGGWNVSEHLKDALQWRSDTKQIPVSYLDTLAVKERCRLSYNFAVEEKRKGPARRQDVQVRVDNYGNNQQFWKVSLGEELYLAPEVMYESLRLPHVIKEITQGLPDSVLSDCLKHILITGGNSDLAGFKCRVTRDLQQLFPELSNVLNVQTCIGSSSWSAMGSEYINVPHRITKDMPPMKQHLYGTPFWLSREEYILFGCDALDAATSTQY